MRSSARAPARHHVAAPVHPDARTRAPRRPDPQPQGQGAAVERAARPLTTRDTILLITHAAGDQRRRAHDHAEARVLHRARSQHRLGHRPHFFGPYSSQVEDAVANAVIAGELHQTVERLRTGAAARRAQVRLRPHRGRQGRVDELIEHNRPNGTSVRDAVHAIRRPPGHRPEDTVRGGQDLSDHLGVRGGRRRGRDPELARRLGWDLDADQVRNTITLLEQLDLLERRACRRSPGSALNASRRAAGGGSARRVPAARPTPPSSRRSRSRARPCRVASSALGCSDGDEQSALARSAPARELLPCG